jgi:hypothetical protein
MTTEWSRLRMTILLAGSVLVLVAIVIVLRGMARQDG